MYIYKPVYLLFGMSRFINPPGFRVRPLLGFPVFLGLELSLAHGSELIFVQSVKYISKNTSSINHTSEVAIITLQYCNLSRLTILQSKSCTWNAHNNINNEDANRCRIRLGGGDTQRACMPPRWLLWRMRSLTRQAKNDLFCGTTDHLYPWWIRCIIFKVRVFIIRKSWCHPFCKTTRKAV